MARCFTGWKAFITPGTTPVSVFSCDRTACNHWLCLELDEFESSVFVWCGCRQFRWLMRRQLSCRVKLAVTTKSHSLHDHLKVEWGWTCFSPQRLRSVCDLSCYRYVFPSSCVPALLALDRVPLLLGMVASKVLSDAALFTRFLSTTGCCFADLCGSFTSLFDTLCRFCSYENWRCVWVRCPADRIHSLTKDIVRNIAELTFENGFVRISTTRLTSLIRHNSKPINL